MDYSEDAECYLIDLWHPGILPGGQELVEDIPSAKQDSVFKLTGWRGAGWHIVFLDAPAE